MTDAALDARIDKHRTALARLLRQRIAMEVHAVFPGATVAWLGERRMDGGCATVERIAGPAREVRWDSERDLRRKPIGSWPVPCPPGVAWSVLDDVTLLLLACLPSETPRTKDGYAIVRLPKTVAGDA